MTDFDFSIEEIRKELAQIGYSSIDDGKLAQFRQDLEELMRQDRSQASSWVTDTSVSSDISRSRASPKVNGFSKTQSHSNHHSAEQYSSDLHPIKSRSGEKQSSGTEVGLSSGPFTSDEPSSGRTGNLGALSTGRISSDEYRKNLASHQPRPQPNTFSEEDFSRRYANLLNTADHQQRSHFPEAQRGVTIKSGTLPSSLVQRQSYPRAEHRVQTVQESGTEVETSDQGDGDHTADYSDYSTGGAAADGHGIRRKVRRKVNGHSIVCDETTATESDFDLSSLHDDDFEHPLALARGGRFVPAPRISKTTSRPKTAPVRAKFSDPPVSDIRFRSGSVMSSHDSAQHKESSQSLIRPMSMHPHVRGLKKHDPVNRHADYQRYWQQYKFPSEEQHLQLRWETRAQMMYYDPVVEKKTRQHAPNTYQAPSEKKRRDLIWETRKDMAAGIIRSKVI